MKHKDAKKKNGCVNYRLLIYVINTAAGGVNVREEPKQLNNNLPIKWISTESHLHEVLESKLHDIVDQVAVADVVLNSRIEAE